MADAKTLSVIIVDDDTAILTVLRRTLKKTPARLRWASSGEEALRLVSEEVPDLVVTDYSMGGGMTGLELLQQLRRNHPTIRGVIHTGDPDRLADQPNGKNFQILAKPCPVSNLIALFDEVRASLHAPADRA